MADDDKNAVQKDDSKHISHVNPVQVQKFLKGIDYPANKQELLEAAQDQGADANVINTLEEMPGDDYNSPNDVTEAIGKMM